VVNWHVLSILNGFEVIRHFWFAWDFPTGGEILGVLGENNPQKVKISKNTCLEGTSLRQSASFELSCVQIGSRVWAVRVSKELKTKKKKKKVTGPVYVTTTWGRHRWSDPNQTWHSWSTQGRNHPCQIWNQSVHNCDFGKGLNLPIPALLGSSPLTRLSPTGQPVINFKKLISL